MVPNTPPNPAGGAPELPAPWWIMDHRFLAAQPPRLQNGILRIGPDRCKRCGGALVLHGLSWKVGGVIDIELSSLWQRFLQAFWGLFRA